MAGVDAGRGRGEEGCLAVPPREIPTPCRPQTFLGHLLGHLRISGQLLGKHRSQSRWGSRQDTEDSGDALPPAGHVPLRSQGISETCVLLCAMGTIKPANLTVQAVPEDEFFTPWRVSKVWGWL